MTQNGNPEFDLTDGAVDDGDDHPELVCERGVGLDPVLEALLGREVAEAHSRQRDEREVNRADEVPLLPSAEDLSKPNSLKIRDTWYEHLVTYDGAYKDVCEE